MCGVLGITIANFNERDFGLIRGLFIQSMIRGKHATGVSYVKDGRVHTIKEAIPADEFIGKQNLETWRNEDGNLYCIGHIRYSTSDLRFNQPFSTSELGIVHNGVISQEPHSSWFDLFNLQAVTANDSELILRAYEKNLNPLQYFHPCSMAICGITADKQLFALRNEQRPLYYHSDNRMTIFTSTKDIAKRAGVNKSKKTKMYRVYTVDNFELSFVDYDTNVEDLQ